MVIIVNKCFFCESINNSDFFLENEFAVAKFDNFPVSNGHLLIIPKRHISDWWQATVAERNAIFELLDESKKKIDNKYSPDGYNIGMNLGKAAGQNIMHLHIHLIPRYYGDVKEPRGGVRGVIPEKQNY